jgi:hypothetical protein
MLEFARRLTRPPLVRASPLAHLRGLFRQYFLVCPFARRDRANVEISRGLERNLSTRPAPSVGDFAR